MRFVHLSLLYPDFREGYWYSDGLPPSPRGSCYSCIKLEFRSVTDSEQDDDARRLLSSIEFGDRKMNFNAERVRAMRRLGDRWMDEVKMKPTF